MPGLITIACVVLVFLFMSDFPKQAKWLDSDKMALVRQRLEQDRAEAFYDATSIRESLSVLKDGRIWAIAMLYFYPAAVYYALAFFIPTILNSFSFSIALSQIL